jgi:hypothetical protein
MMEEQKFDDKILERIKAEKIEPKSKWRFIFKNYAVWLLGLVFIALGSLAFSLIFQILRGDIRPLPGQGEGVMRAVIMTVPIFWLLCLAAFTALAFYNFKNTKKGYRYSAAIVAIVAICLSAVLGGLFHFSGVGERVDYALGRKAPFYDKVLNPRVGLWSEVENGRLSGLVVSGDVRDFFVLVDKEQAEWGVSSVGAKIDHPEELTVGRPLRVLGRKTGDNSFVAEEILPMFSGRGFFGRHGMSMPHQPGGVHQVKRPDLKNLFEKYPDLQASFEQDLLDKKEMVSQMIKNDPDFVARLEAAGISQETIQALLSK